MPLFCHFLWSVELTSTIFVFVREDEETNSIIVYKSNNNPKSVKILVIKIKSSVLVGQIKRWLRSHPPMLVGPNDRLLFDQVEKILSVLFSC